MMTDTMEHWGCVRRLGTCCPRPALGSQFCYWCTQDLGAIFNRILGEMGTITHHAAAAAAKSLVVSDSVTPIDGSPPGSSVPGILQARTLERVAISFSNAWKWKWSHVQLLATPWTAAYQVPPSTGFSRQEYWSGVPLPSPGFMPKSLKRVNLVPLFWGR